MSTAAVATTNQQQSAAQNLGALSGMLEKYKNQIAVALPRHMTPERMIRVALTAVSNTPALAKCAPVTIAASIVQSSILGLEPSSVLGEAYLVPFWNSKSGRHECQLIPGYMGLVKLARNSGEISVIDAQIVYSNDSFEFHKGSDVYWLHKWARKGDRGEPEGVWAGYVLKDGSKNFEYWTIDQIERHRDKYSKGAYDKSGKLTGAWLDSPEWMWKKTVLRQVIKLMPKSVELSTALKLDELGEVGLPQNIDVLPSDTPVLEDGGAQQQLEAGSGQQPPQRKSVAAAKAATISEIRKMEAILSTATWTPFMPEGGFGAITTEEQAREILQRMREKAAEVVPQ